ncbi:alpha-(1,6)-fucosyltransferase isoform X2 [Neocloeon triangulifer]|nr:alpha-(1,6)-fucosyltransferase isoform X2 [Neocloeon triangulifer]XP_059482747.1 alpha-(1,6)-fucosyltransferase isoform X2 [Neocloeon triangulifer]
MRMRLLLLLLAAWLALLFILVACSFFQSPTPSSNLSEEKVLSKRLAHAFRDLDLLKKQNAELRNLFTDIQLKKESSNDLQERLIRAKDVLQPAPDLNHQEYDTAITANGEPSLEYELLRRRIIDGTKEMWYFFSAEMKKLQKLAQNNPAMLTKISHILEAGIEHKRSMLHAANQLAEEDGFADWRIKESQDLSDLVQKRLHALQNPPDCANARKLVCNLNKGCGYGCQIHHAVYCFIVAYGSKRTMILKSKGWRYHKGGFEEIFMPVSETCTSPDGATHSHWPGKSGTQVVDLPIVDSLSPRPPWLPLAVPRDLAPRLSRLHGDPVVWWVSQFMRYLLRPQSNTYKMLEETSQKLGFQRPVVGVHIRRTDKVGTEAAFHPLEEYMTHVEEYFKQIELSKPVDVRRVYLASDDPTVIKDAKEKYPKYKFFGDADIAKTAAVATRYSDNSLNGIIIDIHFLAISDYLVCTFSSQVCRIAYEIMQNLHPDAADRFRSLDDIYYYGGQGSHNREAIMEHKATRPEEIDLQVGDIIGVAGNHWDGYSKGKNTRTGRVGLYPSHKVIERLELVDFPTYKELDKLASENDIPQVNEV